MTQKELMEAYRRILETEVWQNSERMVDHCMKSAAYIVELDNEKIAVLEKPKIETRFCFGYSDSAYNTDDYDRANDAARYASESEDYFMRENLKQLDGAIERLSDKRSDYVWFRGRSYDPTGKSCLVSVSWGRRGDVLGREARGEALSLLSEADREAVTEGYRQVRAEFEKRLKTYLKRYGLSKVRTWSYWRDE